MLFVRITNDIHKDYKFHKTKYISIFSFIFIYTQDFKTVKVKVRSDRLEYLKDVNSFISKALVLQVSCFQHHTP